MEGREGIKEAQEGAATRFELTGRWSLRNCAQMCWRGNEFIDKFRRPSLKHEKSLSKLRSRRSGAGWNAGCPARGCKGLRAGGGEERGMGPSPRGSDPLGGTVSSRSSQFLCLSWTVALPCCSRAAPATLLVQRKVQQSTGKRLASEVCRGLRL